MGIVGSYIMDLMTPHYLKSDTNIRLYVLHKMPNMNLAISVRQGGGYEQLTHINLFY